MPKRYLVTGCAGFIASWVCRRLLDEGHSVIGFDSLNDAYDPRLKFWRLARLREHTRFRFQTVDVADRRRVEQAFRNADLHEDSDGPALSAVIHLAGRAGVRTSVENPWIYYETNVVGTLNLLECCRVMGVPKFVLASTSSVYGGSTTYPFCETMTTDQPLSPYAASKKAAETLIHSYHHLHGIDATCLRYFTVYGPAGRPDMSVFRFIRAIAEGETITVFGDGHQERDFTYVDDIARGTIAALKSVGCESVNLGGDRPVSVQTLIKRIEARLGKTAIIRYSPAHPADGRKTWAKIDKAERLLGWRPETSIEEGLDRTVEWYMDHRDFASQIDVRENVLSKAA